MASESTTVQDSVGEEKSKLRETGETKKSHHVQLTASQQQAWKLLESGKNILMWGKAATGKTFVKKEWQRQATNSCRTGLVSHPLGKMITDLTYWDGEPKPPGIRLEHVSIRTVAQSDVRWSYALAMYLTDKLASQMQLVLATNLKYDSSWDSTLERLKLIAVEMKEPVSCVSD